MTISQLIELLEDFRDSHGDDAEVRIMTQQQYPFENRILGVTSEEMMIDPDDDDGPMHMAADGDDPDEETVWLVEGGQLGYGSRAAWDNYRSE